MAPVHASGHVTIRIQQVLQHRTTPSIFCFCLKVFYLQKYRFLSSPNFLVTCNCQASGICLFNTFCLCVFFICYLRVVVGDSAVPVYGNGQVAPFFMQHGILELFHLLHYVTSAPAYFGHACERVHYDVSAQAIA